MKHDCTAMQHLFRWRQDSKKHGESLSTVSGAHPCNQLPPPRAAGWHPCPPPPWYHIRQRLPQTRCHRQPQSAPRHCTCKATAGVTKASIDDAIGQESMGRQCVSKQWQMFQVSLTFRMTHTFRHTTLLTYHFPSPPNIALQLAPTAQAAGP